MCSMASDTRYDERTYLYIFPIQMGVFLCRAYGVLHMKVSVGSEAIS